MKNPRIAFVIALMLIFSTYLLASAKQAIIEGTQAEVFAAALKVAQADWSVTFADRPTGMISFNTGTSFTSNGMECSVVIQGRDDGRVQVSVKTQKKNGQIIAWGVGDRIADKLFKGIGDVLGPSHAIERLAPPAEPDDADTRFK